MFQTKLKVKYPLPEVNTLYNTKGGQALFQTFFDTANLFICCLYSNTISCLFCGAKTANLLSSHLPLPFKNVHNSSLPPLRTANKIASLYPVWFIFPIYCPLRFTGGLPLLALSSYCQNEKNGISIPLLMSTNEV